VEILAEQVEQDLAGGASCCRAEGNRQHGAHLDGRRLRDGILQKRCQRHREDRDRRQEGDDRDRKDPHRIDDRLDDDTAADAAERTQKRCQEGNDEDKVHL
jgi:hypothetical protein